MEKNKIKKKFGRLVITLLLVVLMMMSATQALVKLDTTANDIVSNSTSPRPLPVLEDNYFTWEDIFNDATKIDPTMSYNYEVAGGVAKMRDTYTLWSYCTTTHFIF
jgi:hypothetical protein